MVPQSHFIIQMEFPLEAVSTARCVAIKRPKRRPVKSFMREHPQLLVFPLFKKDSLTLKVFPQSHWTNHIGYRPPLGYTVDGIF
jgi:hypothetical protein